MKNAIYLVLGLTIVSLMVSCDKNQSGALSTEEALIERIVKAGDVDLLAPADVPTPIYNYVETNYDPYQIEMVFHTRGFGYEVMLENGLCIFFDDDGSHMNHDGMHDDWSNSHPSDYNCMMGDTMDIDMLPQECMNYIDANYPNPTINVTVIKPSGKLSVEMSDETVLLFNPTGELVTECQTFSDGMGMGMGMGMGNGNGFHGHNHSFGTSSGGHCDSTMNQSGGQGGHPMNSGNQGNAMGHGFGDGGIGACWGGTSIELSDLPADVVTYLNTNYPEIELLFAIQNYHGNYMVRLEDCVRIVFDENGVLLFDSGN